MYKIHRINKVHKFNPMHSYILVELGKNTPVKGLPQIQENLLKLAHHNKTDLHEVVKILKRRKGRVLIKWAGYDVSTWEPEKSIIFN